MKKGFTKEAKIGIVTLASLILLYVGFNYLKGVNLLKPTNRYYVDFKNVKELTLSNPVFIDGFQIGLVRDIQYDYVNSDKITVMISLDKEMRISKGSYITLENSFLSGSSLHLHLNKYVKTPYEIGSHIEGRTGNDLMGNVEKNLVPEIIALFPKIDSILVSLQTLIDNPALAQSLNHMEKTTQNLEVTSRQLNHIMGNDIPTITANLKGITTNFNTFSSKLNDLDLKSTYTTINETLNNLKLTTERVNSKDNSLGLLLNDRSLFDNLNHLTINTDSLMIDLKQHPKRYVHFSIF
ncbi:MAG: MlaD family protein [Massilibacteroides sp.]|nr:MlaD family protein [Massilibacteroides sp.]